MPIAVSLLLTGEGNGGRLIVSEDLLVISGVEIGELEGVGCCDRRVSDSAAMSTSGCGVMVEVESSCLFAGGPIVDDVDSSDEHDAEIIADSTGDVRPCDDGPVEDSSVLVLPLE